MKITSLFLALLVTLNLSALEIGKKPKEITIEGENGGLVADDSAWNSSSIKDKVYVMFYVDPDEKDTNNPFSAALKAKEFDRTKFGSLGVINLAATWKPDFIIEKLLKSKQEEFPHTIYVKDKNSVVVKEWKIEDDASNILIFSKDAKLLFYKSGAMSEDEIQTALKIVEDNL